MLLCGNIAKLESIDCNIGILVISCFDEVKENKGMLTESNLNLDN